MKAHEGNRTLDLFLTKEVLYRLSYVGTIQFWPRAPTSRLYIAPSNAVDFISLCLCLCYMPSGKVAPDGAGNGIRTRDLKLGRLALYQLSYSRPQF